MTERMTPEGFIFTNPRARKEMETAISLVANSQFNLDDWDHFLAVIDWEFGKGDSTSAIVTSPTEDGKVITFKTFPVSVLVYHPAKPENGQEDKQGDTCLVFTNIKGTPNPREIYTAYALALGGCLGPETLVEVEDLMGEDGMVLGNTTVKEIKSLTPATWTANPFNGQTNIVVKVGSKGVGWYHGKRVEFSGFANKPTEGATIACRAIDETFGRIRVVPAGGQVSGEIHTKKERKPEVVNMPRSKGKGKGKPEVEANPAAEGEDKGAGEGQPEGEAQSAGEETPAP